LFHGCRYQAFVLLLTNVLRSNSIVTLLGLAALVRLAAMAQETSCLHRILPVVVEDSKGRPIEGLRPTDFQAKLRAEQVKILSIVADDRPHRIVILMDASGSMATKWREPLIPALALAETPLPNTEMALVIFKNKIEEQVGFSQGQSVVAARLRQIRSGGIAPGQFVSGKTALYDSLLIGLQLLEKPSSADSLYLVSDGADNASRSHLDEVARRLTSSGVRLFVSLIVGRLGDRNATPEEANGPTVMTELVRKTGGDINTPFARGEPTNPKEAERIAQLMRSFYQGMAQAYLLEVELPMALNKPSFWELKFSAQGRERWKDGRVNYPTELALCNR
jgi:hypothetical protein